MQAAVAKRADKVSGVDVIDRKYGHNCKATVQINGIPSLGILYSILAIQSQK